MEPVEGWAQRLAKAVKEDSVVILLDACAPGLLRNTVLPMTSMHRGLLD